MSRPTFAMDYEKTQDEAIPAPEQQAEGVIISPDTRRAQRVPPGQSRTKKWPVLMRAVRRGSTWPNGS